MSQNLKARLRRIRDSERIPITPELKCSKAASPCLDEVPWSGWAEAGFKVYERKAFRELAFSLPQVFPKSLAILVPDLVRAGRIPSPGELLFFDLETTGLSGGAGTIAFLAAFGRFAPQADNAPASNAPAGTVPARLEITQYLLLDYPGEPEFIESAAKEFASFPHKGNGSLCFAASYNGKCFDFQILKNRCLMNGIAYPAFLHADLLHPARRLWKRLISDCSQASVEASVLGLDRSGDLTGALAPEIWFSFLRSGENRELLSVCDHNIRDITGLASLFLALGEIAAEPFKSRFRFDEEALALSWRNAIRKHPFFFGESYQDYAKTGKLLLENAARNGHQRAAFTLLRSLAIDSEWRLRDYALALAYTESALALPEIPGNWREGLEKRRMRLEGKINYV